jgi:hypothetical protein
MLNMNYDAHGSAAFGVLSGYASANIVPAALVNPPGPNNHAVVRVTAAFEDVYTFTTGTPGASGNVSFNYTVTGTSLVSSAGNTAVAQMTIVDASSGAAYDFAPDASGQALSPAIPIVFGQPIDLLTAFVPLVNIFDFNPGSFATVDYSETAILTGIRVTDVAGRPVSFTVTSASGSQYTSLGIAPEPSTLALAALGLVLVLFRLRGRGFCAGRTAQLSAHASNSARSVIARHGRIDFDAPPVDAAHHAARV